MNGCIKKSGILQAVTLVVCFLFLTPGLLFDHEEGPATVAKRKAALAAAKRRGVKLGNPQNLSNRSLGTRNSAKVRAEQANLHAQDVISLITEIKSAGYNTLSAISRELTRRGIPTRRGLQVWSPMQVKKIEARAATLGLT